MDKNEVNAISSCRVCGKEALAPIISFGDLYISDFPKSEEGEENLVKAPLELVLCGPEDGGCGLLQLKHTVDHDLMYRNYWYRSGINQTMQDELKDIVSKAEDAISLKEGDYVIDIGSNDGTLLRNYSEEGLNLIGFEPATNIVEKYGKEGITKVVNDYFNYEAWQEEYGQAKARVITAIAMFYDLEDPNKFVGDVAKCLADDGVFIIQISYLPAILERNAFDGTCHEHLEYYSLFALENLLTRHGLEIAGAELRDINEGSVRVYAKHKGAEIKGIGEKERNCLKELREKEEDMRLDSRETYEAFASRVDEIKKRLTEFIKKEVASGKKVYVYGASTKGNTLLQYFGLDNSLIVAAAERNPDKWGRKTVGTNIPIISEEEARRAMPDYFLILPWQFLEEFQKREADYLSNGGKFIVPLPEFKIIGSEDL